MRKLFDRVMKTLGYTPSPKLKVQTAQTKKAAPLTAHTVNAEVRSTLTMARDFYAKRGDVIVSTDLQNYLDSFEDILLHSIHDGCSLETAKLLGLTWEPNATTQG